MKTYIIYNRLAGHGNCEESAKALAPKYEGEVICKSITEIADYAAFVGGLTEEDTLILCGGDGTLNRFVNAIYGQKIRCELLYYAVGTGNDFWKDIGRNPGDDPVSIKQYLENLPLVEVNGEKHRFLNGIGFGIDGYCCEMGDKKKATSTKPVNYTAIAIKGMLFGYKPRRAVVVVDGKEYHYKKVWLVSAMKGRYYGGGMLNAPAQDRLAEDGDLDVVLFRGKGRIKTLIAFPSIFKGEHINKPKAVATHRGKDIYVRYEFPAPLQIDGECIPNVLEYHVVSTPKVKEAESASAEATC